MKIIKLFLLLTFGLWAEFKLDVPKEIDDKQLQYIIKSGWSDHNTTLNQLIIQYGEKVLPEALMKMREPLVKVEPTEENKFPAPKILLAKDDVLFIIAYTKYLESQGNIDKSIEIKLEALEGLHRIKDRTLLSVIFIMVFENIIVDAINQSIQQNIYTSDIQQGLYKPLKKLLTQDSSRFFMAMEGEKKFLSDASRYSLVKQKYVEEKVGKSYPHLMKNVHKYAKEYNEVIYEKMFAAMKKTTVEAIHQFENGIDNEINIHTSNSSSTKFFLSSLLIKIKSIFGITIRDFGYTSEYLARSLVLVAVPKIGDTYLDYLEHIKKNKKLLSGLLE